MSKSNDKQHRTRGTIPSSNTKLPNPLNSYNSPLGSLNNKNNNNIQMGTNQRNTFR